MSPSAARYTPRSSPLRRFHFPGVELLAPDEVLEHADGDADLLGRLLKRGDVRADGRSRARHKRRAGNPSSPLQGKGKNEDGKTALGGSGSPPRIGRKLSIEGAAPSD
jgi:hypothetical protein